MIVIGVDVHKHELTATGVDELGRELGSWSGPVDGAVLRTSSLSSAPLRGGS